MIRMYMLQNWFHLAEKVLDYAVYRVFFSSFLQLDSFDGRVLGVTPLLRLRRLPEGI